MKEILTKLMTKQGGVFFIYYFLWFTGLHRLLSDKAFINLQYRCNLGKKINWENPQTYNEKLQWLKLNYRHPNDYLMVDKIEAKKYVSDIIGDEYIIPTIAVYENVEDIKWEKLPEQFVLKCTHDSGGIVVCKNKNKLDINKAIRKLTKSYKRNYYWYSREHVYKDIKPRIICEQYMTDNGSADIDRQELRDYKFFCFNGVPKALFIATDRMDMTTETKFDYFDMDFNHLPFCGGHPNANKLIERPKCFEKMKELATKLSAGCPHLRVDFYEVNGHVFFGELTFYHYGGMAYFDPEEWNYKFGEWLKLPRKG